MIPLRRVVQVAAILLLLALPVLSRGAAFYQAYGAGASHVGDVAGPWVDFLFTTFSWIFGGLDDPAAAADLFQGGYWSITLFGVTFSDPMAFIGYLAARGSVHWPLAAGVAAAVLLAALMGRFFCGWICPVNTILEINAALRGWIERRIAGQPLPAVVAPSWARYAVLLGTLIVSAVAGFNFYAFVLPYAALARDWHLFVFGAAIGFGGLFLVIVVAVELLIAPRLWCRGLCPTGLVLELIGRWRLFGIRRKSAGDCLEGCQACLAACPVGVNPRDETATEHCLLCNVCVSRCPVDVLQLGTVKAARNRNLRPSNPGVTLGVVLAVILTLAMSGAAEAHHNRGLPHYGYLKNYPQTPTREITIAAPPYEVTLITYLFEGLERDRAETPDDAVVYVAVTDRRTGEAHTGALDVSFRSVGGGEPLVRRFSKPLEETVYYMWVPLREDAYDVAIRIGGTPEITASARLTLADGGLSAWAAAILAVIAAAAASVALAFVRRRVRRRNSVLRTGE